jgi:very-short-patch-repair endonuclease
MPRESVKTPLEATISRTRDDDRGLARLARRQHGVVAWRQLEEAGFRRNAITVRLQVRLALERLTEEPPGRKRSKLEERFAPFLRRYHLPPPRFNDWILLGAKRYQVDCHWPGTGRIVELDGWEGHGTRSAFRDDRERDRLLTVAGYTVTRITWNQLRDEPAEVAADLRALLMNNGAAPVGPHPPLPA